MKLDEIKKHEKRIEEMEKAINKQSKILNNLSDKELDTELRKRGFDLVRLQSLHAHVVCAIKYSKKRLSKEDGSIYYNSQRI